MPFSAWKRMVIPSGTKFETRVGRPIPRFTTMPSRSSLATRRAMSSRVKPADFISRCLDYAVDINAGRDDGLRVQRPDLHYLLHLGDGDVGRRGHDGVEVAGRHSVDQVAQGVGPLGPH